MAADIIRRLNSPTLFDCTNEEGTERRQKGGIDRRDSTGRIRQFGLSQIRSHSSEEEPDWKWDKGRETVSRCSWRHSVSSFLSLFHSIFIFPFLLYTERPNFDLGVGCVPLQWPSFHSHLRSIVGPLDYITPNAAGFLPLYTVYTDVTRRVVCSLFTSPDDVIWPRHRAVHRCFSVGLLSSSFSPLKYREIPSWIPTVTSRFFQRFSFQGLLLLRIIRGEFPREQIITVSFLKLQRLFERHFLSFLFIKFIIVVYANVERSRDKQVFFFKIGTIVWTILYSRVEL